MFTVIVFIFHQIHQISAKKGTQTEQQKEIIFSPCIDIAIKTDEKYFG